MSGGRALRPHLGWAFLDAAQRVVDHALQMHGGRGVTCGQRVERLYREIRALRICEGATQGQKLLIRRELLRAPGVHA